MALPFSSASVFSSKVRLESARRTVTLLSSDAAPSIHMTVVDPKMTALGHTTSHFLLTKHWQLVLWRRRRRRIWRLTTIAGAPPADSAQRAQGPWQQMSIVEVTPFRIHRMSTAAEEYKREGGAERERLLWSDTWKGERDGRAEQDGRIQLYTFPPPYTAVYTERRQLNRPALLCPATPYLVSVRFSKKIPKVEMALRILLLSAASRRTLFVGSIKREKETQLCCLFCLIA